LTIRKELDVTPSISPPGAEARARQDSVEQALYEIKRVIAGQDALIERVLVCLLADGHLLIEGVPGLAKTLTIKTTARVLGGTFSRIQFTPDLVPSDLVGTRVFRPHDGSFEVDLGPAFCNFLLADEINRAPAKVQSALLEVMQERQVTIAKQTFPAPDPFLVMATQNPIEAEGTYPLPEAQIDRFMLKVVVGYPDADDELTVVERALAGFAEVRPILELADLAELRTAAGRVYVDPAISRYAIQLANGTRSPDSVGLAELQPHIAFGASPRGPIALVTAARALALVHGRDYVVPQDVRELANDALHHRVVLSYEALAAEVDAGAIVEAVLDAVPVPEIEVVERAA
jgi:MoxR-like ATPase